MSKRVILISLFFVSLSAVIFLSSAQFTSQIVMDKGSNFERSCGNDLCTITIYSYDKYFNRNGQWEEIDENWHRCGDNFCTNNYYFNTIADEEGLVTINSDNVQFSQRISGFANSNVVLLEPIIRGSTLTYLNVIPNVDLRYQYLPHKLKEELIIKEPLNNIEEDLQVSFDLNGELSLVLEEPFICDNNRNCKTLNYTLSRNKIDIIIPREFLASENLRYPIIIDPSFTIGNSSIVWNGRVEEYFDGDLFGYIRISNPTSLDVGKTANGSARADLDWNLEGIQNPDVINNATLRLFIENVISQNFINITNMEKNSSQWSNDLVGNQHFYTDMRNGTVYSNMVFTSNISNFSQDFIFTQQGLDYLGIAFNSTNRFSTGIDTLFSKEVTISARDNVNSSRRPQLVIVYDLSNSSINDAIIEGINNSLPNNPIVSDQQIYILNQNGQHSLGRFDKTTTLNNQTWSFNYVNYGESLVNMSSLFNILNVWQNSSLNYTEIVDQVQNFINNTLIQ